MKKWIKSKLRLPEQGKKVLCFDKGDLSVRQRFKDYWFPIPYIDSSLAEIDPPELWQEIDFPEGFYGYMKVFHQDKLYKIDEWEKVNPENFSELIENMLNHFKETRD
jgi:hypothetical protein